MSYTCDKCLEVRLEAIPMTAGHNDIVKYEAAVANLVYSGSGAGKTGAFDAVITFTFTDGSVFNKIESFSGVNGPADKTVTYDDLGCYTATVQLTVNTAGSGGDMLINGVLMAITDKKINENIHTYYTVTFYPNNGDNGFDVKVLKGETVAAPADPNYTGYAFLGWFMLDAISPFDFMTPINSDMVLTAKWSSTALLINGNVLYHDSVIPATVSLYKGDVIIASTNTNADGSFIIAASEGGGYSLAITKPGYLTFWIVNISLTGNLTIYNIDMTSMGGDINGDGYVDAEDIAMLISDFGSSAPNYSNTDINGDNNVDTEDLTILIAGFGKSNYVIGLLELMGG
jgi:hypothetical protein